METITIGIDSSTTSCGIAIYINGNFYKSELYKFSGSFSLDKLMLIIDAFDKLFFETKPDIVVVEETIPIRNSKAVTSLNQVFGGIMAAAFSHGAFVDQIHNKVIKKIFKYKTKEEAITIAKELTGKKELSEHEADAILVVETYKEIMK